MKDKLSKVYDLYFDEYILIKLNHQKKRKRLKKKKKKKKKSLIFYLKNNIKKYK